MQSSEMSISSVLAFPVGRGKRLDHTGEGRKAGREARIGDPGEAQGPATQDSTQDRVPRRGTQDQVPRRGTRTCYPEQYPGLGPQERHPRSGPQEDDQKEREEKKEGDGSKGLRGREGREGPPAHPHAATHPSALRPAERRESSGQEAAESCQPPVPL